MNTTAKWSSQIKQVIMFNLNKKLFKLGSNTNKCIYLVSTTAITNALSGNMPQYAINQHEMQKSHATTAHMSKGENSNQCNPHHILKNFPTKFIIFIN